MVMMQRAIERSGEQRAAFYRTKQQSVMVRTDAAAIVYGISFHQAGKEAIHGLEIICTSEEAVDEHLNKWAQTQGLSSALRYISGWYPLFVNSQASLAVGSVSESASQIISNDLQGQVQQVSTEPALYLVTFPYLPDDIEYDHLRIWEDGELKVGDVILHYCKEDANVLGSYLETYKDLLEREENEAREREEAQRRQTEREAREAEERQREEELLGDLTEHPF